MKITNTLLFCLIFSSIFAQDIKEKEVDTKVNEVTIFLKGAQITREKTVDLNQGKTIVKFINLSPFIDAKSIQVKARGELTVLSVNHQQNYLDKSKKPVELVRLEEKIEQLEEKVKLETTYLSIIKEELAFLQENRDIGGKNQEVSVINLKQASDFYSSKLTALKLKEIERNKTLKLFKKQITDLRNQIKTISNKKEFPTGEILVKVDAKLSKAYPLELSYVVENASWFPTYDIRAKNINEPVQLIYKANVKQDTKVDWLNAKLKFSSADPNISGVAPELQTYFLDYYTAPPSYTSSSINSVSGKVLDNIGEPLPGATITIAGTTIGTITDVDGNYSITIPNNASQLKVSFIGFVPQTLPIRSNTINVSMQEDVQGLDEVVVVGYGAPNKPELALQGRVAGVSVKKTKVKIRGASSLAMPTAQIENQTTVDFEIKTPYTIKSDNKNYVVDMDVYDLPALYQYYCIPKIDTDAFLIANIVDWEKYNLLEGEANLFFEETYVGKTLLDVRFATDTLEISLGRDKKVSVKREKLKDFTNKQFIGNKKQETRAYKTVVKNNKNQPINMILFDQVPVSILEEIDVKVENISGAKHDLESGEIKWKFKLEPTNTKEFDLRYSVKYPKSRSLEIE